MGWCQVEENDWFDKYLPGPNLPDGLQWIPFTNVDLTTDPELTTYMYPGFVSSRTYVSYYTADIIQMQCSKRDCKT